MAIARQARTSHPRTGGVRYCAACFAVYRTDFERCPHDGGELAVAMTDPLIGQTIGGTYVVDGLLGQGAMGRVYAARHRTHEARRYALKVLIGDLAASSAMRVRFAREAENASRLDHPNVVSVVDHGCTPRGLHYLVMELVDGITLADLIARTGPMWPRRVIRIAHQLCEGLAHAHARGVIHRDFKSENILVSGEPGREVARIADFGLAMTTDGDTRLTTTGVACTPAYAAPEQLRGQQIDHRVDLYGLGTTMFEMLSGGYLPFDGDLDATIHAKLAQHAPSIVTRAPNVPPGLVTLVARLLAHDPEQRPRSAHAVIEALATIAAVGTSPRTAARRRPPMAVRPAPMVTRYLPVPRRRRWPAAVAAVAVLAMGGAWFAAGEDVQARVLGAIDAVLSATIE